MQSLLTDASPYSVLDSVQVPLRRAFRKKGDDLLGIFRHGHRNHHPSHRLRCPQGLPAVHDRSGEPCIFRYLRFNALSSLPRDNITSLADSFSLSLFPSRRRLSAVSETEPTPRPSRPGSPRPPSPTTEGSSSASKPRWSPVVLSSRTGSTLECLSSLWEEPPFVSFLPFPSACPFGCFASLVNAFFPVTPFRTTQWRFPIALQILFAVLLCAGVAVLPESPRWLFTHGHYDAACQIVADLSVRTLSLPSLRLARESQKLTICFTRSSSLQDSNIEDENTQREIRLIVDGINAATGAMGGVKNSELFIGGKKQHFRRMAVGASSQIFQQLGGCNAVIYYATVLFEQSLGLEKQLSLILGGVLSTVYFMAALGAFFLVETLGRRKMCTSHSSFSSLSKYSRGEGTPIAHLSSLVPLSLDSPHGFGRPNGCHDHYLRLLDSVSRCSFFLFRGFDKRTVR
jgi:hypothetical protein